MQNRSLRKLVKQLRSKAQDLLQDLKVAKTQNTKSPSKEKNYHDYIEQQLQSTRKHHRSLDPSQDIALDLSLDSPLPRRAAALRNAVLLAEKEALDTSGDSTSWPALRERYQQIFSFYEDYGEPLLEKDVDPQELEQLNAQLENARKRISNLEKFKQLYFNLEEQWKNSKDKAQDQFNNLSNMAQQLGAGEEFEAALGDYHQSYSNITQLIERGVDTRSIDEISADDGAARREIEKLRSVAADQHRIIENLQAQLRNAATDEERHSIINTLQDELAKQSRFVQESETCIQLLEDELSTAHHELDQLKSKVNSLPAIKTELIEMRSRHDEMEIKLQASLNQNRQLKNRLKQSGSASSSPVDAEENARLHKAITEWESRYNELEEKFLDLKLQQ
ncbi:hypothetical protein [Agaribacterium haliotis]|uniref:hypothetical protein n=1 Tax=Agaribacterium haliotis TaxID=2013869 RepID=UPI000BB56028|nr:hypothetical protein [Agaribacterium haliotis]